MFTAVQKLPTILYAGISSIHLTERSIVKNGRNIYLGPSAIEVNSNILCHFKVGVVICFNISVVLVIYVLMFLLTWLVSKRLLRLSKSRVLLSKYCRIRLIPFLLKCLKD